MKNSFKYYHAYQGVMQLKSTDENQENNKIVRFGSWMLFSDQGLPVSNEQIIVSQLRYSMALNLLMPTPESKKIIIPYTQMGKIPNRLALDEIEIVWNQNKRLINIPGMANTNFELVSPDANLIPPSEIGDILTVDINFLREISRNAILETCSICSRVGKLTEDSNLHNTTIKFNDKNYFYTFLKNADTNLKFPEAIIVEEIPKSIIVDLINKTGEDLITSIINVAKKYSSIDDTKENTEFFIKISCSGGGFGICRLQKENEITIKEILRDLIKRKELNKPTGLQLLKKISIGRQNHEYPLNPENKDYFSPCLTLRIDTNGQVIIGQVADQVLKNGTEFIGSFWNKIKEEKFIEKIGRENIIKLGKALHKAGYSGYFGTDFIKREDGNYELVVDPNARLNGNDYSYFARKSLEKAGTNVNDTFLTNVVLTNTEISTYEQRLSQEFASWMYDPETQIGIIIIPWIKPETIKNQTSSRKVDIIYINPSKNPVKFLSFFEYILSLNKKL